MKWNFLILLTLAATSCQDQNLNNVMTYRQEAAKPVVALLPIIDRTKQNLSSELTDAMRYKLNQTNTLFLVDSHEFSHAITTRDLSHFFGTDLAWLREEFERDEFAVFLELVEHKENTKSQLSMTLRLRVVDLRKKEPQVILQELISQSHTINNSSSIAMAHQLLIQEASSRIQDYILLARGGS